MYLKEVVLSSDVIMLTLQTQNACDGTVKIVLTQGSRSNRGKFVKQER